MRLFDHEENERTTIELEKDFAEVSAGFDSIRLRDLVDFYCEEGAGEYLQILGHLNMKAMVTMESTDLCSRIVKLLGLNQFISKLKRELD